jgi:hypothetical protein
MLDSYFDDEITPSSSAKFPTYEQTHEEVLLDDDEMFPDLPPDDPFLYDPDFGNFLPPPDTFEAP